MLVIIRVFLFLFFLFGVPRVAMVLRDAKSRVQSVVELIHSLWPVTSAAAAAADATDGAGPTPDTSVESASQLLVCAPFAWVMTRLGSRVG